MLKDLRRRLKTLADAIADEAERNPEFAKSVNDLFGIAPAQETKRKNGKTLVPDPFEVLRLKGNEGFNQWLNALSIQELRAIVRQQRFDPSRLSDKWKTKDRFVLLIIGRVESRSKQGDTFRSYGKESVSKDDVHTDNPGHLL
ncbi:MAG: hypothetical protein HY669_03680 [Chloroflexi bacterium]|nr:hypothetical protein [Chloroflexota bacterium]